MQKKINFNNALVLSILWHLSCFFLFSIVIVPVGISQRRLSEVYFVGTLLDRGTQAHDLIKSKGEFTRRDKDAMSQRLYGAIRTNLPATASPKRTSQYLQKKIHYEFNQVSAENVKKLTPELYTGISREISDDTLSMKISSAHREILFTPPLSGYTQELKKTQADSGLESQYSIEVLALIRKDGIVESAGFIKTSGIVAIDDMVRDYIIKCRFLAVDTEGSQELDLAVDISFKKP